LFSKSKWQTAHEKRREEKRRKLLFSKSKWQPPMVTKLTKLLFPTCQKGTTQNENKTLVFLLVKMATTHEKQNSWFLSQNGDHP
jgi:hypothetical protein